MNKAVTPLVLCAALALGASAVAQTILPREVRQRILQAVVEVVAYDPVAGATLGSGSGTIVSPDGYVLTNFHVVDDGTGTAVPWAAIFVTDPAAPDRAPVFRYWARYVGGDPANDLALIEIVEDAEENPLPPGTTFVAMPVGDSGSLIPGDPITVVGYPGISGATITFTSGIVSGFVGENLQAGGKQWIKTDAKLARGNSGGGAFDQNGVLVGIPTLGLQTNDDDYLESQDYLRPVDLAWPLLTRHVAGIERVGGVAGQLVGGRDAAADGSGPSPLDVMRSRSGALGGVPAGGTPAPGAASSGPSREQGALEPGDLELDSGEYVDVYAFDMTAGALVTLELSSDLIDPYLLILDPRDAVALEVDDSANAGLNVAETFVPATDGTYLVVVTSAFAGEVGAYELQVRGAAPAPGFEAGGGGGSDASDGFSAPLSVGTESGFAGELNIGARTFGEIAANPDAAAYHTYQIDVPTGTATLTIRMEADADLDVYAKQGDEIASLANDGDWDFRDIGLAPEAMLQIDAPAPGPWFVDVVWLVGEEGSAHYQLRAE